MIRASAQLNPMEDPDEQALLSDRKAATLSLAQQATWNANSPRERVVRDILRGLYEGRYKPGQRLIEAKLTEAYGISRGPVREALNRLSAMGVVSLAIQRGGHVRKLTISDAVDILTVVQGLMRIAARLAATRLDQPGAADRLKAALAHLEEFDGSSSSPEYAIARDDFYSTISELSGNAELQRIMPSVQIHLIRVQFRDATQVIDRRRHAGYRRIVDALLSGRPADAEMAVQVQFGRTIKHLQSLLQSKTA